MSNGFGIEDKEYEQLKNDDGYFKGFVAAKLINIEKQLAEGKQSFSFLHRRINRNTWYIAAGVGGFTVIIILVKMGLLTF